LTGEKIVVNINSPAPVLETIEVPKRVVKPEPIKEVKKVTPAGIPDYLADCVAPAQDPNHKSNKIYAKPKQHDTNPAAYQNKFKDDGTLAKEEIVKDREVPTSLLEAERPPVQFFKIKCTGCGKKDVVDNATIAFLKLPENYNMRYLCNDCVTGARGSGGISNIELVEAN
jgi:ribosomal protein S27E